jgi:TonB family protein
MRALAALMVLLCAPAVLADEAPVATVRGFVADKTTGAPLAGVSVSAAVNGKVMVTVRTGANGRYLLPPLAPGRYAVVFVYGTTKVERSPVVVSAPGDLTVDAAIDVAASSEVITIRERARPSKAAPATPVGRFGSSPPPYSDEAIDEDVWARAWLLLDVDATGRVTAVQIMKKAGHGLDEIAVREAKKLRFQPARDDDGRAIATRVALPMEWPSYWYSRDIAVSTGVPPCRGSGPLRLGSFHPTYRDCSVPTNLPAGVTVVTPSAPPVQFLPF